MCTYNDEDLFDLNLDDANLDLTLDTVEFSCMQVSTVIRVADRGARLSWMKQLKRLMQAACLHE